MQNHALFKQLLFLEFYCTSSEEKMHSEDCQKAMLLSSMQKLIDYVSTSKQNRWEIFQSLSKEDVQKIINNFSDLNHRLRKLSLTFLGILLNNNNPLKERLCQRIQTVCLPGKICLNFSAYKSFNSSPEKLKSIIDLLKSPVSKEDEMFPIWMISLRKEHLKIDFIPIMALSYVDPLDNLVGFTLVKEQKQNPKKLLLSIFESITKPSEKLEKKTIFTVAPLTTRNCSPATEKSQRFTRTSNPKTSLKHQSLKGSLIVNGTQTEQKNRLFENQKYISQSQAFKSESSRLKNEIFSSKTSHDNSINKLETIHHRIREELSTAPTNEQRNANRSVINNTHIYINVPVNSISINYKNYEDEMHNNQVFYPQTSRNYTENPQNFTETIHLIDKQCSPEISFGSYPIRKYERVTKKLFDIPQQDNGFNFDQYRNFVNKISIIGRSSKVLEKHMD